jgi:hypothetical protein
MTGLAVVLGTDQIEIRTMVQVVLEGVRLTSEALLSELGRREVPAPTNGSLEFRPR